MSGTSSPDSAADPAQLVKRRRTSGVFNTCAESLSVQEEQTKQLDYQEIAKLCNVANRVQRNQGIIDLFNHLELGGGLENPMKGIHKDTQAI